MPVTGVSASNRLAEILSLLKFYPRCFMNREEPHSYQRQLNESILSEDSDDFEQDIGILRMLETAAVCLSTTDNGSHVAAAIEGSVKSKNLITLVLAKNRNSNDHDQEIAVELLLALRSAIDFQQALKFIRKYQQRIQILRQSFFEQLQSLISLHSFKESAGEEFRSRFTVIVLNDKKWNNKPVREILENLLEFIRSVQELDNDVEASHARFVNLVRYALMLKSSRYMSFVIHSSMSRNVDWYLQLKKFCNALDRIVYFQRIEKLQKFVHDRPVKLPVGHHKTLFMQFITPDPRLGDPLPLHVQEERFEEQKRLVQKRAPSGYWDSPAQIPLSLHPEVRIVLDPAMSLVPHRLIGCSTRSCLCCTLWLDAYSHLEPSVSRWQLGRFGQDIDVGWALPGKNTGVAALLPLDQIVTKDVEEELHLRIYEYVDTYKLMYP
ncbi:hypothetical protein C0995_008239 [Termitomyces sp. Mi166|nr:hypothetical protein C0995_008239 [Termitomyces sp. Mi166\